MDIFSNPQHLAGAMEHLSLRMRALSQPTPSAQASACHRVFGIFELAEDIFTRLSMSDLLVNVQRACKDWREIVQNSTPIQEILFLKPVSPVNQYYAEGNWWRQLDRDWYAVGYAYFVKHPLLEKLWTTQSTAKGNPAVWYPEASWRRQLVTQPALMCCSPRNGFEDELIKNRERELNSLISRAHGLRMSDIEKSIRQWPVFWIEGSQCWQSLDYGAWSEAKKLAQATTLATYRDIATRMLGREPRVERAR